MNDAREIESRRPVGLSLASTLVDEASALSIDLTRVVETALRSAIAAEKAKRWRDENADAIAANNEDVRLNGLWCDDVRLF